MVGIGRLTAADEAGRDASELQHGQITIEQANVELAAADSQIISEAMRRQAEIRSASAQQAAAAAAYMGAMRAALPPVRQPVNCIRTGNFVNCY